MSNAYRKDHQEMTSRLLAVLESMRVLGLSTLTLSKDGKVETQRVTQETYFVSSGFQTTED